MTIYEHFSEQELEVLRARAERAAHSARKDDNEKTITALQVTLGRESYALPVEWLRAVYENAIVVPVPCTPDFVAGIANVRGRILPVLDLAILLNVSQAVTRYTAGALVVANNNTMTVAFVIETVGEIVTFAAQEITQLPDTSDAAQSSYLRGILPDGAGLLDIAAVLNDPNLIVSETF